MNHLAIYAAPAGRILIAAIFVLSGINKITSYEMTAQYMSAMGVPSIMLPMVIAFEIAAGLSVIAGWQTRIAAFLLAVFCIISGMIFHGDTADQMQFIMLMKNFAMAGGFLFLVANGAGVFSLDNRQ